MDRVELAREDRELRGEQAGLQRRLAEIEHRRQRIAQLAQISVALDAKKLIRAARVLHVVGSCNAARLRVVRDAQDAILEGGGRLRNEYFATKNYARWVDQRSDCSYGRCPSHGSVVFRVGLRDPRAARLDNAEIAACMYALDALAQQKITGGDIELLYRQLPRVVT
jgi:hypothetical protein